MIQRASAAGKCDNEGKSRASRGIGQRFVSAWRSAVRATSLETFNAGDWLAFIFRVAFGALGFYWVVLMVIREEFPWLFN